MVPPVPARRSSTTRASAANTSEATVWPDLISTAASRVPLVDHEIAPSHWEGPFAQLAEDVQLAERDVAKALARVRVLVERILAG